MLFENKVSSEFAQKVRDMSFRLGIDPNWIMFVMWNESAHTFSPSIRNPQPGQTATGLIQFIESTAKGLGTTTAQLAAMSAVDQLDYVEMYLNPYAGKMHSVTDVYLAVFYPASVTWDNSKAYSNKVYKVNKSFDFNGDKKLTKQDFVDTVNTKYNALLGAVPKSTITINNDIIDSGSTDYYHDLPAADINYPEAATIKPIPADQFNTDDYVVIAAAGVILALLIILFFFYLKNKKNG